MIESLTCLVVGERNPFTIQNVDEHQQVVGTLAIAIKEIIKYSGDANDLILFKAVKFDEDKGEIKENSDYMRVDAKNLITLSQSKEYVNDETFMFASRRVCRYFDSTKLPNEGFIHVLVNLPKINQQPSSQYIELLQEIVGDQIIMSCGSLLDENYLNRDELVDNLLSLLDDNRFVVISSPPATGKTSVIQFAYWKYSNQFKFYHIKCYVDNDPFMVLESKGIDLKQKTTTLDGQCIVVLDKAHNYYTNKSFWTQLINHTVDWLPAKFIISADHDLPKCNRSPVELHSLPHIQKERFLLTDEEGIQLINNYSPMIHSNILQFAILRECCGVIGAIKLGVYSINQKFKNIGKPKESEMLQYFFSNEYSFDMERMFNAALGIAPIDNVLRDFLKKLFVTDSLILPTLDQESMSTLLDWEERGVLVETDPGCYGFSSPLAKRLYFNLVFYQ